VAKNDLNIFCVIVQGYELSERPS